MSALRFDFDTVCVDCKGVDCDITTRCSKCTDDDTRMTDCVSLRLCLKGRLLANSSLEEFVGDLPEERVLCPVRTYLAVTSSIAPRLCSLLVSPHRAFSFRERSVVLLTAGDSRFWCRGV